MTKPADNSADDAITNGATAAANAAAGDTANDRGVEISLILATRNRLAPLQQALPMAIRAASCASRRAEVIVVDNGSTDGTTQWLAQCLAQQLAEQQERRVRVVQAKFAGLSRARNVGCLNARGSVIVFTDDDVAVHEGWLDDMTEPIFSGQADAVAARVALHPSLDSYGLSEYFRRRLAETTAVQATDPPLVGAGMAFSRDLLQHAMWDPDLGAGVTGRSFGEDVLFEYMLKAAGARIVWAAGPPVIHNPSTDRFDRDSWLAMARAHGRTDAYLSHHWLGAEVSMLPLRLVRNQARLKTFQLRQRTWRADTVTEQEMELTAAAAMSAQLLRERREPAKYRPHG